MATTAIFTKKGDSVTSDEYIKTYNDKGTIYQKYVVTATLTDINETNMTATLSLNQKLTSKYVRWGQVDKYFTLYVNTDPVQNGESVYKSGGGDESSSTVKTIVDQTLSFTIPYNSDGNKTITVGGKITGETGTYAPGNKTLSISITLPIIAKPSTFTITGSELGKEVTLAVSSSNSAFKHKAEYAFENSGYKSIGENLGTEIKFTPSIDLAAQAPNASSGKLKVKLTTFNGTTQIGSPYELEKTLTIAATSDTKPEAGTLVATATSDHSVVKTWGNVFVKGYSKATITFNGAAGKQGATISKYAVGGGGLNINNLSTTNSFTTEILNTTSITLDGKVIDSRGFESDTISLPIALYDYSSPTITIEAERCDENGTTNVQGTCLKVTPTIKLSEIDKRNTIKTQNISCNGVSDNKFKDGESFVLKANVSTNASYTLTASITDTVGNTGNATVKISSSNTVPMHINEQKNGMGLGSKAISEKSVTLGWTLDMNDNKIINADIVDLVYPVDSIYMSINSANPATLFGGTWEALGGRFLIGANSTYAAGTIGGTASTTLTTNNLPSHSHKVKAHSHGAGTLVADNVSLTGDWGSARARFPGTTNASGIISVVKASRDSYWTDGGSAATNTYGFSVDASHGHTISGSTANSTETDSGTTGSGESFTNLPPYLSVYMWKRTK